MSALLMLEGGGETRSLQGPCREGFRTLLEKCGYARPKVKLVACGSRQETFKNFKIALSAEPVPDFVAMWIDSEDPLTELEDAWKRLASRDKWSRPNEATDEQVLFMTTCVETMIVADRGALKNYYGAKLQDSALPPLQSLEKRQRQEVQKALVHATRNCTPPYAKTGKSFELLAKLSPSILEEQLPSFKRVLRILAEKLI